MSVYRWVVAALFVALLPAAAAAQIDNGRISGNVRDSSGAWVPDATVTARNEKTGEVRSAQTNNEGFFIIAPLKPSTYTIKATKDGFAIVEYTQMPVAVGQELSLDLEFKPAGVEESVTVVAASPVLDLSSARVGANVSQREVEGLPVNGRQMSQLMLQAPGSQNAGDGTWQDIRFSGRANEQNVIKYDGVEGSAIIDASPGNANGENKTPFKLQASLENVQEFRVESSGYPAEFGTGTGGQVNVVTKSGGNLFHGAVFEYLRDDALDARNHFDSLRALDDSVISEAEQSKLSQNQFGGSIGGPIFKDRAFFFGSYEGYRLTAGKNLIEGVPSEAAWARPTTSPAILALKPYFLAPGAQILTGVSTTAGLDVAQLQADQHVDENSFSARFDYKVSDKWSAYARVFHDQGTSLDPVSVTGRIMKVTANPSNAVFNLQGLIGDATINEFKVGYNAAPTTIGAQTSAGFEKLLFSIGGNVANSGIAGQGGSTGLATLGGLVRVNSAGNGAAAPYDPYSLTFADSLQRIAGTHLLKGGVDVRMIRMTTDQLGGTTYAYSSLDNFLLNVPSSVLYFGDLSEPSPFNDGATGERHTRQEYYVGYFQDEWRLADNLTMNYGLRYDYYSPLNERDDRISKFNIETGALDPSTTPLLTTKKDSFQPRFALTYSPRPRTVFKGGVGIFVGPGQTEDQIQPIEADRISTSVSSGALNIYPTNIDLLRSNFTSNPNGRSYQPRAYSNDYILPEKVYQYTASVQQELPGQMAATVSYVGSQGRNLFLRSIANRIVGVVPTVTPSGVASGRTIREFDIVTCANGTGGTGNTCPGSTVQTISSPYAEIDYKTSGGHDSYNSMQLSLTRRSARGLVLNGQYTLGYSKGNTGGSNEAVTASNNARSLDDFEFEDGYNNFDVRHTFNFSALYNLPGKGMLTGGWSVGGIANARSGLPMQITITRPDIVYVDPQGLVWQNAQADRVAMVNVPGGGATRNTRRPNLIPGVDPFVKDGGRVFLNPAAFSIPGVGEFGDLERNSLHGPIFRQIDMVVSKRVSVGGTRNAEFRLEVFNVFNTTNFALPPVALGVGLPTGNTGTTPSSASIQPGAAYTTAAAGSAFGVLASTAGTSVGLGTNRQVQLGFRFNF